MIQWIVISCGISPKSNVILVYRIDGTFELAYKGANGKYYSKDYRDIREGSMLQYWMNIDNPIANNNPEYNS